MGCALGECPVLFPEQWRFKGRFVFLRWGCETGLWAACAFFGLSIGQSRHLFMPEAQFVDAFGGRFLNDSASRFEVATNIYDFIRVKERELGITDSILTGEEPSFYVPEPI